MSQNVAAYVLDRLHQWGVTRIYGYPGDGINGLLGAFHEEGDKVEFIQTRHEEIAAFAACAHAKFTGEVGVCMATSGPGAIHLLNGLYDAKLDRQPVVAIVGQQKRASMGASYQQEIDLNTLFKDVASEYVQTCAEPSQARQLVDRAMRTAMASRSVTCIIIPEDVQESPYEDPPRAHGSVYTGTGVTRPCVVPRQDDLRSAAEVLNSSEKVAMLIGQGAAHAKDALKQVADLLGTGVAKALNGRVALPDDLSFVTGPIGLLGSKPSHEMVMNCDCLFMIGTSFPYAEWLPKEGQAKCVEIDIDARMIGIRYPVDVPLIGDSRETLQALIPLLRRKEERSWRAEIEDNVQEGWRVLEKRSHEGMEPMTPSRVLWELSAVLPDDAVVTADSGSSTNWWARELKLRKGMLASLSGNLATMGPGTPYAIAAKFAFPERAVVAIVGDGAFQMT